MVDVQAFIKCNLIKEEQKSVPFELMQVADVDIRKATRIELD